MPLEVWLLLFMMLAVLYDFSPRFRYGFRFLIVYGGAILTGLICLPLGLLRPRDIRNGVLFTRPLRLIGWLLGIRWEVRGKQYMRADQACVVVANHQSAIDVLGMVEVWPYLERLSSVMKREVWYSGPFGLAAYLCGQIFIDRRDAVRARESINHATRRMKEERIKVWFFPEGTRNDSGELLPFKKGAFHMALTAQVPILPIVFSSYRSFLDGRKLMFRPGRAIVEALEPIPTAGLTRDDLPDLMERVRRQMAERIKQLTDEVESNSTEHSA